MKMISKMQKYSAKPQKNSSTKRSPFSNSHGSFFGSNKIQKMDEPFFSTQSIQAKLTINQPNDKYEQEADSMADKVTQDLHSTKPNAVVQSKCENCNEEEDIKISKKPIFENEEAIPNNSIQGKGIIEPHANIESQLLNSRGGGSSMDKRTQNNMEQSFGADFSGVKVHTDHSAIQMNQELGAQAFTNGSNIYFNKGKYNPNTKNGNRLLAHELTHTVQQGVVTNSVNKKSSSLDIQSKLIDSISSISNTNSIQKAEDLTATRFMGNNLLERVFDNLSSISQNRNSKGNHVRLIQQSLLALNYQLPSGADGDFGAETEAAIRLFQIDNGVAGLDGVIGPETMRLLDMQDPGTTGPLGPVAPAVPVGPIPPATNAIFSEALNEQFSGYDNSVAPNWLVVPVNARRRANVAITPATANPTFVSDDPTVAIVQNIDEGIVVTGVGRGTTNIKAMEGANVLATLRISVKNRIERTVDFHFMSDSAVPAHQTNRSTATADRLTATLNQLWNRQANIRFRSGTVDTPTVLSDLGGQVLWTAALPNEWNTVTAFATGGNLNVFLVWEYEQDATPLVDNTNAGTLAGNCILEDNECGDALTVAHEAGHFLGLGHTGNGIMTGCPGANRRRVFKVDADIVNP